MSSPIRTRSSFAIALAFVLVLAGGCDAEQSSLADVKPSQNALEAGQGQAQLPLTSLTIASSGVTHEFKVEVADNAESRRIGLMHRRELADDHGMLFDFKESRFVSMWMQNTHLSLDMLFIDRRGLIRSIAESTVPYSTAHIHSATPVWSVLELNAGTAKRLGLRPGDRVMHSIFENE